MSSNNLESWTQSWCDNTLLFLYPAKTPATLAFFKNSLQVLVPLFYSPLAPGKMIRLLFPYQLVAKVKVTIEVKLNIGKKVLENVWELETTGSDWVGSLQPASKATAQDLFPSVSCQGYAQFQQSEADAWFAVPVNIFDGIIFSN